MNQLVKKTVLGLFITTLLSLSFAFQARQGVIRVAVPDETYLFEGRKHITELPYVENLGTIDNLHSFQGLSHSQMITSEFYYDEVNGFRLLRLGQPEAQRPIRVYDARGLERYAIEHSNVLQGDHNQMSVRLFDGHLLLFNETELEFFQLKKHTVEKVGQYTWVELTQLGIQSANDLLFRVSEGQLTLWATYVRELPHFLHLRMDGAMGKPLNVTAQFGKRTFAETLPSEALQRLSLLRDGQLWVQRQFEQQIDIYSEQGELLNEISLDLS